MNRKIFSILVLLVWASLLVAPVYAARDDFDSPKLDLAWIVDNPTEDGSYDLTEKPGSLKITCAAGDHDIWSIRGGGPAVVIEAPEDYTVETHFSMEQKDRTTAGLCFLNEDAVGNADSIGPWYVFTVENAPPVVLKRQHAIGIDEAVKPPEKAINQDSVFLKVTKSGQEWTGYYKEEEGGEWELIFENTYDIGKKHYVDMIVKNWSNAPEISASFDYFDASWKFFAVIEPAAKLTTTWAKIKR